MAYTQRFENCESGGTSWWEDESGTRANWIPPGQGDTGQGNQWTSFTGDSTQNQAIQQGYNPFTQQMEEWEAGLAAAPRFGSDTRIFSGPS